MCKGRIFRWLAGVGSAAALLQAGSCSLNDPQVQAQLRDQFIVPALGNLFSDLVFFMLDNALVRLTT
jgi:hypothetical protein